VRIGGRLQALLSRAELALGRLTRSIETLPDPDRFVPMFGRKEAVASSQIAGAQSSLHDLLAAEAQVLHPAQPRDVAAAQSYAAAIRQALASSSVSVLLIREIHAALVAGPRHPLEPQAVAALNGFLHAGDALPPLVRIGLGHARFQAIRPFPSGNGCVGRLLITLLLQQQQVLNRPVLYLSHYFRRHQQSYHDLLQASRDGGVFEPWLEFFLTGVTEIGLEASVTARRILALREQHRDAIAAELGRGAGNGHRTLEHLLAHPIVSVADVRALTGSTYPAANRLVERLTELGLLLEVTGQARNRRFRYEPYVRLFADEPTRPQPRRVPLAASMPLRVSGARNRVKRA
jgi:Fic family protein